jgi:hypothetical protein
MDWNPNSIDSPGSRSAPPPNSAATGPASNDPQDIMLNMLLQMGAFQYVAIFLPNFPFAALPF